MRRMHADREKLFEAEFEVRTEPRSCIEAIVCCPLLIIRRCYEAEILPFCFP